MDEVSRLDWLATISLHMFLTNHDLFARMPVRHCDLSLVCLLTREKPTNV